MIKVVWFTSLPIDITRFSSPTTKLRHDRKHAYLSLKFVLKLVYSLLRSVAGSSLSFSFRSFPNCSFSRELASVFADYLRSHFSARSQRPCVAEPENLSELGLAIFPEKSHSSFCSPFSPAKFLVAATNLSSSIATGPDKVAYPCKSTFLFLT